jgi:hypothetical protein
VTSAQRKIRREKELRAARARVEEKAARDESARCVPPREEVVAPARSVDHTVCRHIEDEDVEDEGVTSAQRKIRREKELRAARARVEETVKTQVVRKILLKAARDESARCVPPREEVVAPARSVE